MFRTAWLDPVTHTADVGCTPLQRHLRTTRPSTSLLVGFRSGRHVASERIAVRAVGVLAMERPSVCVGGIWSRAPEGVGERGRGTGEVCAGCVCEQHEAEDVGRGVMAEM